MKLTYKELEKRVSDLENELTKLKHRESVFNEFDLMQINQKLIKSVGEYRIIYTQSPIAIEIYNTDGFLIDTNQACLNLGCPNIAL